MTDTQKVSDALAAAGIEVRPLVWKLLAHGRCAHGISGAGYIIHSGYKSGWVATGDGFVSRHETIEKAEEACNAHHAAAVLSMLQVKGAT